MEWKHRVTEDTEKYHSVSSVTLCFIFLLVTALLAELCSDFHAFPDSVVDITGGNIGRLRVHTGGVVHISGESTVLGGVQDSAGTDSCLTQHAAQAVNSP